mmetsp:Transcript_10020/g.22400  ORF Transcript_10020/g.22400 Transcript_10020/m.22400 type:complete len:1295 (-) Transcript_10020:147-4031(-)
MDPDRGDEDDTALGSSDDRPEPLQQRAVIDNEEESSSNPSRSNHDNNSGDVQGGSLTTTVSGDDETSVTAQSLCDELAQKRQISGMYQHRNPSSAPPTTTPWLRDQLNQIGKIDELPRVVAACVHAHVETVSDGAAHTGELASDLMSILGQDPPTLEIIFAIVPRADEIARNIHVRLDREDVTAAAAAAASAAATSAPSPPPRTSLAAATTVQKSMKSIPPETIIPEETEIQRTVTPERNFSRGLASSGGVRKGNDGLAAASHRGAFEEHPASYVEPTSAQLATEHANFNDNHNAVDSTCSNDGSNEISIPIAAYVVQDESVSYSATNTKDDQEAGCSCYCGRNFLIAGIIVLLLTIGAIVAAVVLSTKPTSKESNEFLGCSVASDCAAYDLFCSTALCEDGVCEAVDSDSCPPNRPVCVESIESCFECQSDTDCDNGNFCDGKETCIAGSCVDGFSPCNSFANCSPGVPPCNFNGSAMCDEQTDECVYCLSDADCQSDNYCDGVGECLSGECVAGNDPCSTDALICQESSASCVECVEHSDCPVGFNCDTKTNSCSPGIPCSESSICSDGQFCNGEELCADGMCTGGPGPCTDSFPICLENEQECVECIKDRDCGSGLHCNTETNVCQSCTKDEHCEDNIYCNGYETCTQGGICIQGQAPCSGSTPFCLEQSRSCVECTKDFHCDNEIFCDGQEKCLAYACIAGDPCSSSAPYCNEDEKTCSESVCNHAVDSCYTQASLRVCRDLENENCQNIQLLRGCPVTFYCGDPLPEDGFCNGNTCWNQLGFDLMASEAGDHFGENVGISSDGDRLVISARYDGTTYPNGGEVQVYSVDSHGAVTRFGDPFFGEAPNEQIRGFISGNGKRVAVGPNVNHTKGVRVYEIKSEWRRVGEPITSESSQRFGRSVGLSEDGSIVAVGDPSFNKSRGRVQVYTERDGQWQKVGDDILGTVVNEQFGWEIALSRAGDVLAIGGKYAGADKTLSKIQVYELVSNEWLRLGPDITSTVPGDRMGLRIALSASTDRSRYIVATSTRYDSQSETGTNGALRVFKYREDSFQQMGQDIIGGDRSSLSPLAVALSEDGTRVVLGSEHVDKNRGHVKVYDAIAKNVGEGWPYEWKQVGGTLIGQRSVERFGSFVSLSSTGRRLAVGARLPADSNRKGVVRLFDVAPSVNVKSDCARVSPSGSTCRVVMKDALNNTTSVLEVVGHDGGIFYATDRPEKDPWTVRVTVPQDCEDCPLSIEAGVPSDVTCNDIISDHGLKTDDPQLTFAGVEGAQCTEFGVGLIHFLVKELFYFG